MKKHYLDFERKRALWSVLNVIVKIIQKGLA